MFEPYTQDVWPSMELMQVVLRTKADPVSVTGAARQIVRDLDPAVPLADVSTLATLTRDSMASDRFSMLLVGFFGVTALLLATVGLYGVIAYATGQRTREIGIRMALGAQRRTILRMILSEGLRLAGGGILLGVAAALGMGRLLRGFLYGVRPSDPLTLSSVALFIALIALCASYLPARRAAAIDPMEALRCD
ncbi:MAG TPA: FtsX-like permease family protein [Terracidiphilus sp.]|nr:FtsX-like permease family protein [Terracidiphilus sp.]